MKRWIICGVNHHGYLDMIARGFRQIGCDASVFSHQPLTVEKLATRNPIRRLVKMRPLAAVNDALLARCRDEQPDALLCINAEAILPTTLRALKGQVALGFWAVDAMENVRTPPEHLALFDHRILFVPDDMEPHHGDLLLGYGHDTTIYKPLDLPRDIDLSFVGAPHLERLPILDHLAAACLAAGISFQVWGPSYFSHRSLGGKDLHRDFPSLAKCVQGDTSLDAVAVNELYNRSRMVLNIHANQCRGCLNARTFEILASGAVGVIDDSPAFDGAFERGRDLVVYRDIGQLCQIVTELAADPARCQVIADAGRAKSLAHHTFAHRAQTIRDLYRR